MTDSTTRVAHLDGGMPLLLTPAVGRRTVGLALSLGVGSRDDPAGLKGAAHLLGRLMLSAPLPCGPSLDECVERLGGTANAVTGPESLTLHARVPSDDAPAVAGWMLDALTRPALTAEALDRQRRYSAWESALNPPSPAESLQQVLLDALLPAHPLGGRASGTPDGAEPDPVETLSEMHQQALATVPVALACVGDVQEAVLRARISPLAMARAGGVRPTRSPRNPVGRPALPDPAWPDGPCRFLAGAPAPAAEDPGRHAFALLAHLLDTSAAPPAHRRRNDGHGPAHVFRAWTRAYSDAGVWCCLAATDGAAGAAAARALRGELDRLAQRGPARNALAVAVRRARTELLRTANDTERAAVVLASRYCVTGAVWRPDVEAACLARVTAADVARAAAAVAEGLVVAVRADEGARDARVLPEP